MTTTTPRALSLLALFAACTEELPPEVLEPPEPGLTAKPRWLTFDCVAPGCETKLKAYIEVVGDRPLAVKRIVLDDDERTDFSFETARRPPFVLRPGEPVEVEVTYRPNGDPRLGDVNLLATYTDAAASEGEDRVEPGELELPLVRRLIGEPAMEVSPSLLSFGGVGLGGRKVLPIKVRNTGFGNVGLVIESIESDVPDIGAPELPTEAILPGEEREIEVVFSPTEESFRSGRLTVRSFDPSAAPAYVEVRGTAVDGPAVEVEPAGGVDFGEIEIGQKATRSALVTNMGNAPLEVRGVELVHDAGGMLTLKKTVSASVSSIGVLKTAEWKLELDAKARGPVESALRVRTSDPSRPEVELPIRAIVTQPEVLVSPGSLDFGALPRGWVETRLVEIQNVGYGALRITDVQFVVGSSDLFRMKTVPTLPLHLAHGERIGFEIEFRAETEAEFTAKLAVSSSDVVNPYVEITLGARGVSCLAGCPVNNGQPSCAAGICSIGGCNDGFYDTDRQLASGCECREIGTDPGMFCPEAHDAGTLNDGNGDRAQFTGLLPVDGDVDLVRFYGQDGGQVFEEAYDVRISLASDDPAIEFCVYRRQGGESDPQCVFQGESCPGASRSYRDDGSWGAEDGADYVIKVFRRPGAAPTCTPYTVFMRNG